MEKHELELLKLKADKEREVSLAEMLLKDGDYINALKNLDGVEQELKDIGLNEEQKRVVILYMSIWDTIQAEYSTYSYLAGVKNAKNSDCSV